MAVGFALAEASRATIQHGTRGGRRARHATTATLASVAVVLINTANLSLLSVSQRYVQSLIEFRDLLLVHRTPPYLGESYPEVPYSLEKPF